ncbi:DUF1876 domain-containing protein [Haloechinothrix sp. LS1_15]|uniref:DUF1876 domain-containing protein n=1 Tax=Haloechinothrix sp. LS1_15 TaxID=2652248 RepID=UPI0029477908|nr:DUF1876 domain-containing protein [Haloechinothrix sp. LS1_15]MDV6014246.1 DUF1876 domain-containing protein [Haloechinothrix sp. LS1_15]
METKRWTVDIHIDEYEDRTRARATLRNRDETGVSGEGIALLNPSDLNVPEIGDELAVARALAELANRLLDITAGDIEAITHEPVHLRR